MRTDLVPTMPAAYAVVGPLQAELAARDLRLAPRHASLWTIAPRGRYAAQVNGEWISRRQWHLPLRDGDLIVFVHVAHGGGGSNPLRFILQLAVIALSVYTGGAVGAAYGQVWGSLAAAGVAVAGSLLVNALVPLPTAGGFAQVAAPSPTYTVAIAGNQARLGASIPVGYGHELVFPDFGAQPYAEFDDADDQYYCAAFIRGLGEYEILGIYIDDTPLENFQGVNCKRVGPGQSARAGPFVGVETFSDAADVVDGRITSSIEIGGQDLIDANWRGPFTACNAGATVDTVYIDVLLPRGLGTVQNDGSIVSATISYEAAARPVDNRGRAIGEWIALGSVSISAATTTIVRRSKAFTLATAARYQVRVRRTSARSDNDRDLNDVQWVGLRARLAVASGIARTDVTGLVVRIRANEQLSGLAQRRIAVLARRLIPIWSGTAWGAPQATRNPAHAFADLLHDATYGRGLADSRIDLDTLTDLAATFETRQDRFDFSFDTRTTVDEALRVIARAGRALPVFRRGAVYTMVRDSQQAGPVAAFMPRNMAQDSFQVDYALPTEDTADAVRLTYRSNYSWADEVAIGQVYGGQIYAYDEGSPPAGVPAPNNAVDARLPGVAGRNHALREAAYIVADAYWRRTRLTWDTELEGLVPAYGSLVSLAHDISSWAQSGDVLKYDGVSNLLYPADLVTWTPGQQHYVRIQARDGSVGGAIAASFDPLFPEAIRLASSVVGTVTTDSDSFERTRFLFGALSDVLRYARINAIVPQSERSVRLSAVIEDDRVHAVDVPWLPTGPAELDPPSDGGTVDPVPPGGGTNYVANVTSNYYYDFGDDPSAPTIWPGFTLNFGNDGRHEIVPAAGTPMTQQFVASQWLSPQPVTTDVAALYEIRFETLLLWDSAGHDEATILSTYVTGTLDTWLALGTTRSLAVQMPNTMPPEASARLSFYVRIRRAADSVEVALATITIELRLPTAPGGGA